MRWRRRCKRKFAGRVLTIISTLPIISSDSLNIKVLDDQIIMCFLQTEILDTESPCSKVDYDDSAHVMMGKWRKRDHEMERSD